MAPIHNDIKTWLEENEKFFQPPICNKLMYQDHLKTFFVGGPNSRKDFHMEEGEEFFYMLKGDMTLVVDEMGKFRDIPIKEGEVFLLPARIPHSPQRLADTIGLVIERQRIPTEMDCLRYYVENSHEILYEKWFHCKSLEELGPLIEEFFASEAYKTGKPIPGSLLYYKPIEQDFELKLMEPFPLRAWLEQNSDSIDASGRKKLFEGKFESQIYVLGEGEHTQDDDKPEIFLWQIQGKSSVCSDGKVFELLENQTMLIPEKERYTIRNGNKGRILTVVMGAEYAVHTPKPNKLLDKLKNELKGSGTHLEKNE